MSKFVVEFGKDTAPPATDGRLEAPAFQRNHEAIWSALSPVLDKESGDVLELGSGTGQHATEFARRSPHLTWWPSDIVDAHIASISAWRKFSGLANLREPQRIDLTIRAGFGNVKTIAEIPSLPWCATTSCTSPRGWYRRT